MLFCSHPWFIPGITAAWLCFTPIRVQMVCRQAGGRKRLSCCTRAKVPFALEPGMRFPSRGFRHNPAIRGWDPVVFFFYFFTDSGLVPARCRGCRSLSRAAAVNQKHTDDLFSRLAVSVEVPRRRGVGWVHVSWQIVKPRGDDCPENLSRQFLCVLCAGISERT